MSYAPILDPSAYETEALPQRRRALAAASILERLAADEAHALRQALLLVQQWDKASGTEKDAARAQLERGLVAMDATRDVMQDSALPSDEVMASLVEQLRQVHRFGELSGRTIDSYVSPLGQLIRSGRVELFAGSTPRSTGSHAKHISGGSRGFRPRTTRP